MASTYGKYSDIPDSMLTWRILRKDYKDGRHEFITVPFGMEIIIIQETMMATDYSCHEVVNVSPFKLYFDLECALTIGGMHDAKYIMSWLDMTYKFLLQYDKDLTMYNASDSGKFSMHIYCQNSLAPSMRVNANIAQKLQDHLNSKFGPIDIVDVKAYGKNHSLRIPYSPKTDGSRRLLPLLREPKVEELFLVPREGTLLDSDSKLTASENIPYIPFEIPSGLRATSMTVYGLRLDSYTSWMCPKCNTTHDSENALLMRHGTKYYFKCRRADKSMMIYDVDNPPPVETRMKRHMWG